MIIDKASAMISLAPIVEPVSVAVFVGGPLSVGSLTAVVRPFKVGLVAVVLERQTNAN